MKCNIFLSLCDSLYWDDLKAVKSQKYFTVARFILANVAIHWLLLLRLQTLLKYDKFQSRDTLSETFKSIKKTLLNQIY